MANETNTYEAALEAAREATKEFRAAQIAYRTMQIGDVEFLAAKKVYELAEAAFDAAHASEAAKHNHVMDEYESEFSA